MKEIQISQRSLWLSLLTAVAGLYALAGVVLNPFIIWVSLPLYIGYTMVLSGIKKALKKKQFRGMGYIAVSLVLTYSYHLAWFFDWNETKTGSSTSAILFFIFPVYVALLAFVGYFVGPYVTKISITKP